MIGRVNTGGGTGGLNFQVVGNPQPSNPKENTIWAETDVPITSYIFNATEPTEPAEGMMWFPTGVSSPVEFNALKKNGIQVYPTSAKQYVGGAWVQKEAKTYQNGAWVDWIAYLYNNGDECTDITGGWKGVFDATDYYSKGTITKKATNITVSLNGIQLLVPSCTNTIDLTDWNTLKINVLSRTSNIETTAFAVWGADKLQNYGEWTAYKKFSTSGVVSLDVKSLSGKYKVGVLCAQNDGSGIFSFDKVWRE